MATDQQAPPATTGLSACLLNSMILPGLLDSDWNSAAWDWQPFQPGVAIHWLYRNGEEGSAAALIHFQPGGRVPLHEHRGYEHILVLQGSQTDEDGLLTAGSLKVNPPGTRHSIVSEEGCVVLAIYEKRVRLMSPPVPLA